VRTRLQEFGFRKSEYERPTQNWVCGRGVDDEACEIGPDPRGGCRATFECEPLKRGDRWACTRPEARGGACPTGPQPDGTCARAVPRCQPVRSTRGRRGSVARWVSALTLGVLLILIASSTQPDFLSPGHLTFGHSKVESCGTCHTSFEGGRGAWLYAAFAPSSAGADSERCLACHGLGENARGVHGLTAAEAAAVHERAVRRPRVAQSMPFAMTLASFAVEAPAIADRALVCATCHREHQGQREDLAAIDNQRCQACHVDKFDGLANGHPAFSSYPFERRARIKFDHASHIGKHFREADEGRAPTACAECHRLDASTGLMHTASFEIGCAGCHGGDVIGEGTSGPRGIAVLVLPGLDVDSMRAATAGIGAWPEDSEGEITPFLELLLGAGDAALAARVAAARELDLLDLSGEGGESMAAVTEVAWAFKELTWGLTSRGQQEMLARTEAALGRPVERSEAAALAATIPVDALRAAQRVWFPDLATELAAHRAGRPVPMPGDAPIEAVALDSGDEAALSVRAPVDDDILGEDDDILGEDDDILDEDDDILGEDDDILGEDDDILGEDDDILGEDDDILGEDDDILGEDDDILAEDGNLYGDDEIAIEEAQPLAESFEAEALEDTMPDEDRMRVGGWFRDDFALLYRPAGHADPFIRAWLDATGARPSDAARRVFDELSAPRALGKCAKCHSIDAAEPGTVRVNWKAAQPATDVHRFTRFDHGPHLNPLKAEGCTTCHKLDNEADFMGSFDDHDASSFVSNFAPVEKTVCAECHVAQAAGESCTTCHNYHVGVIVPVERGAEMAAEK
jgi:hypothetical protein